MHFVGYLALGLCLCNSWTKGQNRQEKFLSAFQIVSFNNDACAGTGKNGTCYTSAECEAKGGTNSGSCAQGYGVCCVFSVNCGATSNENCTYFDQQGGEVGQCAVKICKCQSNICQLRLDFNQFTITGPSTSTLTEVALLNGSPVGPTGSGVAASVGSQCLTDSFSVTDSTGGSPPTICGVNTNEHMYVDASPNCNDLVFQLGANSNGAAIVNRQWSIKVTQYSCDFANLAPSGCTQYFFGADTNNVRTFNFLGGQHLADQNQNICVRRESQNCRICWAPTAFIDFAVSGKTSMMGYAGTTNCCGYGTDGLKTLGFDCLSIPGAQSKTTGTAFFSRFCGRSAGLVNTATGVAAASKTFCTTTLPFNVRFLSDNYEFIAVAIGEAAKADVGFQLAYSMDCP
ncbi:uncharacterized protein LOC131883927 [Tigriopus californicus]|uniref:uncharacterized protein LOC131883927 n=1 Tax=Tigriopus californicus TaxID=6832 RepID=UPI0027DA4AE9|nr:uncharacterized protein LOC131883927 [Tigriopus californicus]